MSVPRTTGRVFLVPRAAWFCCLGCSPAHARTRTVPYWRSSVCNSAVGGSQLAGAVQSNLGAKY